MTHLVFDIETFALEGAEQYLEPVSAPSNYKDPGKIAAYCEERRADLLARCALDPDLCIVVAAGWTHKGRISVQIAGGGNQERVLLEHLWREISDSDVLIGFNLLSFDLPVLIRRSQYLGIQAPPINMDRYRTPHIDLMEQLSFHGKIKAHSLDFYCKRFGLDVADPHSGSDVDGLVKAGDWAAVASHCGADVKRTKLLAERLGYLQTVPQEVSAF